MNRFDVHAVDCDAALRGVGGAYNLLVATVGYEARGRYVPESAHSGIFPAVLAYVYNHNRVLSFEDNLAYYRSIGAVIVDDPGAAMASDLQGRLEEAWARDGQPSRLRVAVDISCMDRDRLGRVVRAVLTAAFAEVTIDFLYAIGEYDAGLVGSEGQVIVNRAVSGYEGWTNDPTQPVVAVVGCGVEARLALAAVETLEPSEVLWLVPQGEDPAYDSLIAQRNQALFDDSRTEPYYYAVTDPFLTISDLRATVGSIRDKWRVVLVPLGPKIFVLACLLVAAAFDTNVTVWRLSADDRRTPEDRYASGSVVGLSVDVRDDA